MEHLAMDIAEEARIREEFGDCFYDGSKPMPFPPLREDLAKPEHAIHLKPNAEVPNFRGYQMTAGETEIFKRKCQALLECGYITPSDSKFASPALLVKKAGPFKPGQDTHRLVVDYRALNEATIRSYRIPPNIRDLINTLHGNACFTSMDIKDGFYNIRVRAEDRGKTAFVARDGNGHLMKYEWCVMAMGLVNSPSTFQETMDEVFAPLQAFCMAYLDDIIIFTKHGGAEHWSAVRQVLAIVRKHQFKLNGDKCKFARSSIKFLGFIVSKNSLEIDPEKTEAIRLFPRPNNKRELRRWVGGNLASFLRPLLQPTHVSPY